MRPVALFLVLLALVIGPAWADPVQVSQPTSDEAEIFAPEAPLADQPLRTLRLEPPERMHLWQWSARQLSGLESRPLSLDAPRGRAASLRAWETRALHALICVFLH